MEMPWFFLVLDPYLIWFYRLTGNPGLNFFLGTLALCIHTLALGELSQLLILSLIRRQLEETAEKARHYQELSIEALKAGDRAAYEAANKLANEAFGKSFFQQLALSAPFLWPIAVALGWMQYRFLELEFPIPGLGISFGFIGIFILCYVAAFLLWRRLRRTLLGSRHLADLPDAGRPPG